MQAITGFVLIGLCVALVRFARPRADGAFPALFQSDGSAIAAILTVTGLGSLGVLLVLFQLTGVTFGGPD
jgi:hypothetical protein